MRLLVAAAFVALLALRPAAAQFAAPTGDGAGQSQSEMNQKAHRDFLEADRMMGEVYAQVLKSLHGDEARRLMTDSQTAWLAYRDAEAAAEADQFRGGSMARQVRSEAYLRLTRERIALFNDYLHPEAPFGTTKAR